LQSEERSRTGVRRRLSPQTARLHARKCSGRDAAAQIPTQDRWCAMLIIDNLTIAGLTVAVALALGMMIVAHRKV